MTVSSETSRKTFAGDDVTTSFGTSPVVFFDNEDIVVYVVDDATGVATTLTENSDYTLTGGDGAVGTIRLDEGSDPWGALLSDTTLVIVRTVATTQETDFVNGDPSDAEVLEDAFDRLTMIAQQLKTNDDRVLRQPDTDPVSIGALPNAVDRASLYLGFDADGDPVALAAPTTTDAAVSAFMETVLDDTTAVAARTTLGAAASGANTDITSLASPALGAATATTQSAGDNSTKVATTAYADAAVAAAGATAFTTGDVKLTLKTTADSGWVLMDDKTIGDASSGATGRANADTESLFTLLWNNTANAQCAVSTGRGANAAADFAAHKTIALPKALGRALSVYGSGAGLTSRALALAYGDENLASHTHTGPSHTHTVNGTDGTAGAATNYTLAPNTTTTGTITTSSSGTGNTGSAGTGSAGNIPPSIYLNVMIKL